MPAVRTCLTGVLRCHSIHIPSRFENLPLKNSPESSGGNALQRTVQAALCLHVGSRLFDRSSSALRHIPNLQIFDCHPAILLRYGSGSFEHEVLAAIANASVQVGNLFFQSPALAARDFLAKVSRFAQFCQFLPGGFIPLKLLLVFNYVEAIIHADISRADDVKRNEETTRRLLRSYARHQGAQISAPELAKDIEGSEGRGVTDKTILGYLNALKKIFVIEDLPAWNPNLRSKTDIRTSDTRYFSDPSIAAGALGIGPQDLLLAPKTFGFVFETLCVRDLRVYAEALDGNLYHYRDKSGLECDAVIHRRNGAYGLIEIKLGSEQGIADGVRTLKALADKLDTTKMQKPSFLMVLTALGDFAYQRDDGVLVVPIASLGP